MVRKEVPDGVVGRGLRLSRLGFSLTGSYLGYQMQNLWLGEVDRKERRRRFNQRASRRLRQELATLRGPVMKLGQLLSQQTHALAPEVIEELAHLQMRAPGMHPTLARAQFKAACGRYPEEAFRSFEPVPMAAASLGQVHRAVTHRGETVAVKIQYPAMRAAIESDFRLLRSATFPGRLTGHFPPAILDEIQRGFLEETDYVREGHNLEFLRGQLAGFAYLTIPKVYWAWTTERVLTMSFVTGLPLEEFLKQRPPAAVRDLIGRRLVELYQFQLQWARALHADQHPGNFLLHSDGRIGMVDFGCVKRLSFDAGELVRLCIQRAWRQHEAAGRRVAELIWGPAVPWPKARRMFPGLDEFADTLFPMVDGTAVAVDFGQPRVLEIVGRVLGQAVRNKLTNPEFAFVSRADLGLYTLLHQLRARVNVVEAWRGVQALEPRAWRGPRAAPAPSAQSSS